MLKPLSELFDITFICPDSGVKNRDKDIKKVAEFCSSVIVVPIKEPGKSMFSRIRQLINLFIFNYPIKAQIKFSVIFEEALKSEIQSVEYDFIQLFSQVTAVYNKVNKTRIGGTKLIVGPGDDMYSHEKTKRQTDRSLLKRFLNYFELRSIITWQNEYIQNADYTFFFSKEDIHSIKTKLKTDRDANIIWLPGIIEYEDSWSENTLKNIEPWSIVFVGGLSPWFNREGVIYFANKILPIIHDHIQEAKFYVIGFNPGNKFTVDNLNYKKGVEIVGTVDSIRNQLERMAVFVSPILSGAGVKTKVIEALRFGKPVVATSRGVSGLWDKDVLIIRDEARELAMEVISLLQDDNYRLKKNYESRQLYLDKYSYSVVSRQIKKIYTEKIINSNPR